MGGFAAQKYEHFALFDEESEKMRVLSISRAARMRRIPIYEMQDFKCDARSNEMETVMRGSLCNNAFLIVGSLVISSIT